ncbi:kinase-like domain-containing protein [Mycena leptocephala]|nr:kinase-like domain-containing protein [Mycena leptocephala]
MFRPYSKFVLPSFFDIVLIYIFQEFGREALIWCQLCLQRVLPFLGLYHMGEMLCLASPWVKNRHITKFRTNNNRTNTDRLSLMLDMALALQYLHEKDVVHGDLKGVWRSTFVACIADLGVSSIGNAMAMQFTHSMADAQAGTARYQAPELFRGESQNHFGSDVYAFAGVCYEVSQTCLFFPTNLGIILFRG